MVSSELARTEVARAVARITDLANGRVVEILQKVHLVALSTRLLTEAGRLAPPSLSSLDAIHLASALLIRDDLEAFVAYDDRLLESAAALGMPVASPS
jgi:predicted nucleic acid-binding protein